MNESTPLTSIITPVFNSEKYLSWTIQSVINQTYQNWELILINDNSTDESLRIIEKFKQLDKRIISITNPINSGQAYCRNLGIELAHGDYIAFLDSDDLWKEEKLSDQLKFCSDNNVDFCYTAYSLIDDENKSLEIMIYPRDNISDESLLKYNSIGCLTVLLRREILNSIKFIENRHFQGIEDNICWIQIFQAFPNINIKPIKKVLAFYRITPNSSSSKKFVMFTKRLRMLDQVFKLNKIKSLFYISSYIFIKVTHNIRIFINSKL